jgi:thiosulfate/3-mercaptopyruvate sulfurtransferase
MTPFSRRDFLCVSCAALGTLGVSRRGRETPAKTWLDDALIEPAKLAALLRKTKKRPTILCVGFPDLYKRKHILHARFAGPANKPEGLAALRTAVAHLSTDAPLVIYCGCCPMRICPNIHAAYRVLQKLGFRHARMLNLPRDFHTNWEVPGYPVEA